MAKKVETTDQLEAHLSKYIAAYRKSYKICRHTHLSLQIFAGLLGCGAVLALVPVVPIFVAVAGALPAGISVVISKAQLKDKGCHRNFKQLFCEVQMNKMRPDVDEREIIRETFLKILQLEKGANFVVPFERYMKKYKLYGYYRKEKNTYFNS